MWCAIASSIFLLTAASCNAAVDYARDVQPIFASHCYSCHGPQRALGGLRLDDAA
jgi:mono/diheme cytochrome c family protein